MPSVLVFQLEVYYKIRLLTGITAQQKGTPARWYSNKTFLYIIKSNNSYGRKIPYAKSLTDSYTPNL